MVRTLQHLSFGGTTIPCLESNSIDCAACTSGKIDVHNPHKLASDVLHKYFRHSKYASFQRQLNYFGFRKLAGKGKMSPCSYVNDAATMDIRSLLTIKVISFSPILYFCRMVFLVLNFVNRLLHRERRQALLLVMTKVPTRKGRLTRNYLRRPHILCKEAMVIKSTTQVPVQV